MATALKLKNDIKKLKAAIGSKATPKSFVPKLKAQLDKAENELASLKKSGRPRKTSTTKGTEKTLTALQKLIQKKKYGVYQGAGVDLKKDAGEGAFATGRRVSKGLKSNQWGDASENRGNVYYEYRPNRLDVKQPKKKQSYPKLEKGGKVYSTDMQPHFSGNDRYIVKTDKKEETFISAKEFNDYIKKLEKEGYKRMASGGYMAKGGKLEAGVYRVGKPKKVSPNLYEQKIVEIFENGDIATASDYGRKLTDFKLQSYPIITTEQLEAQYKMEKGGYMAKGGETVPYIIWVSKDGEKREFYGDYKSQRAADMAMRKLWDSSDYKSMGNKPKKMYEKEGFYAKGGGIYSSDSLYILTISKDGNMIGHEPFRAKNMKEAREMAEDMEEKYTSKLGGDLEFSIKQAMAEGGETDDTDDNGGVIYEKIKNYPIFETEEEAKSFIKIGKPFLRKQLREGKIVLLYNGEGYYLADVKGGYMADGGETDMLKEDDYVWNAVGKKLIVYKVTDDEYFLSGFMQKGASPWSKVKVHEYIKNGEWSLKPKMADGGEVGRKFSIREMKEKLNKMFPDSFGFTVGNFSKEGDLFKNSSALIVDRNSPFNGLQDSEIKSNLFFPQYKRDHDIRFRIYQGGENTYFYFLLESENTDQYIGQFGFKDEGDVSADYITRFIAFLMEQYGLPFEVKHSVMAKGGYMAGGGEMHKADYFKDGGKVFSEKELKEILDEALGHFYQGLNQIDLAMRYLEVKGQGGLKKPLSDKLKLNDLRESIEKIDEYISK